MDTWHACLCFSLIPHLVEGSHPMWVVLLAGYICTCTPCAGRLFASLSASSRSKLLSPRTVVLFLKIVDAASADPDHLLLLLLCSSWVVLDTTPCRRSTYSRMPHARLVTTHRSDWGSHLHQHSPTIRSWSQALPEDHSVAVPDELLTNIKSFAYFQVCNGTPQLCCTRITSPASSTAGGQPVI
jgi:hypothetical protein